MCVGGSNLLNFKFLEGSQSFFIITQVLHGQICNCSTENRTLHLAHNTQVLSNILFNNF